MVCGGVNISASPTLLWRSYLSVNRVMDSQETSSTVSSGAILTQYSGSELFNHKKLRENKHGFRAILRLGVIENRVHFK